MDSRMIVLLLVCCAAVSAAACMSAAPAPAGTAAPAGSPEETPPGTGGTLLPAVSPLPAPSALAVSPAPAAECAVAADCVPAQCCHPTGCIPVTEKRPCSLLCTAVCQGPLDCGAGSCGCVNGSCSVVLRSPASGTDQGRTSLTIRAAPRRYSPVMSSTPGIALEPVASGFLKENATFRWKATYGGFLSWNSTDYTITKHGSSITGRGDTIYWSFIDLPPSTEIPVTITATATDTGSGRLLGSSAVTLAWEGNYSVAVQEIR